MTPARKTTHRLALIALIVFAIQSLAGMPRSYQLASYNSPGPVLFYVCLFGFFVALALWSFFIWKLWKKPRGWSLGLGIFFCFVLLFQIHLWHLAVTDPARPPGFGSTSTLLFALYEIPLAATITLCFLLRRQISKANTAQPAFPPP